MLDSIVTYLALHDQPKYQKWKLVMGTLDVLRCYDAYMYTNVHHGIGYLSRAYSSQSTNSLLSKEKEMYNIQEEGCACGL